MSKEIAIILQSPKFVTTVQHVKTLACSKEPTISRESWNFGRLEVPTSKRSTIKPCPGKPFSRSMWLLCHICFGASRVVKEMPTKSEEVAQRRVMDIVTERNGAC